MTLLITQISLSSKPDFLTGSSSLVQFNQIPPVIMIESYINQLPSTTSFDHFSNHTLLKTIVVYKFELFNTTWVIWKFLFLFSDQLFLSSLSCLYYFSFMPMLFNFTWSFLIHFLLPKPFVTPCAHFPFHSFIFSYPNSNHHELFPLMLAIDELLD